MNKMKFSKSVGGYFLILAIITFSSGSLARGQKNIENKGLKNFNQISENFYRGAQPTKEGVKELAKMGVKTIINLRGESDLTRAEERWAKAAGVKFINIPLSNWFEPKAAQVQKVLDLIDDPKNQPVFVHCKRGADRTGIIVAVYRITRENWTARQANSEAKKFGFGWWQVWMKDYINDYYKDFIAGK
ncbi:MAG: protein tyrosine phosphatase family protein [Pyrinomonadaceae bacterium]